MAHLNTGDRIPQVDFQVLNNGTVQNRSSEALFGGRTVVLFALPGAFTPTCSNSQLPGYNALAPALLSQGVDEVVCVSVNDAFVMAAWGQAQESTHVSLLADGNGDFTRAMGMDVEKTDLGFGTRSWRYSMLVRDGVIEQLFSEPNVPGDPYEVSDPQTMLSAISGAQPVMSAITLFVRHGCSHCDRAKDMLTSAGLNWEQVAIEGPLTTSTLLAVSGSTSTPQVYVDGTHIGGADALAAHLQDTKRAA